MFKGNAVCQAMCVSLTHGLTCIYVAYGKKIHLTPVSGVALNGSLDPIPLRPSWEVQNGHNLETACSDPMFSDEVAMICLKIFGIKTLLR